MKLSLIEYKRNTYLSINDIGSKDDFPIIVNHGMIASIKSTNLFDVLVENKRRIICIARPGYGKSSPYRLENVAEWGKVANTVIQNLNLQKFDILGMSSGAPYSYSIAHFLPEATRNIYIFSGTPALFNKEIVLKWPYPINKEATLPDLQKLARELFFPNFSKEASENDDLIDSFSNDCFGIALDLQIRILNWGFNLADIKSEVNMQHSIHDSSVPFETAEMTARLLPNCHFIKRIQGDHFSEEILRDFFKEVVLK